MDCRQQNDITLITESGYLMLVKSFTDDLAWKVQRELVNFYFRGKSPAPERKPHDNPKMLNGEPVITVAEFSEMFGISRTAVSKTIIRHLERGTDYYLLEKSELMAFRRENPSVMSIGFCHVIVISKSGINKLTKYYQCSPNTPEITEVDVPMAEKGENMPVAPPEQISVDECTVALGVLGFVRERLKHSQNDKGVEAINIAIRHISWELSKRMIANCEEI